MLLDQGERPGERSEAGPVGRPIPMPGFVADVVEDGPGLGDERLQGPVLVGEGAQGVARGGLRRRLGVEGLLEDLDVDVAELADLLFRQALRHELLLHRPDLGARDVADEAGEALLQRVDVAAAVQVADDVLQDLLLRVDRHGLTSHSANMIQQILLN